MLKLKYTRIRPDDKEQAVINHYNCDECGFEFETYSEYSERDCKYCWEEDYPTRTVSRLQFGGEYGYAYTFVFYSLMIHRVEEGLRVSHLLNDSAKVLGVSIEQLIPTLERMKKEMTEIDDKIKELK